MNAARLASMALGMMTIAAAAIPRALAQEPSGRGSTVLVVTPEQAKAVETGQAWLASTQNEDGSWTAMIGYKLNTDYRFTEAQRGHVGVHCLDIAFDAACGLADGHGPGAAQRLEQLPAFGGEHLPEQLRRREADAGRSFGLAAAPRLRKARHRIGGRANIKSHGFHGSTSLCRVGSH